MDNPENDITLQGNYQNSMQVQLDNVTSNMHIMATVFDASLTMTTSAETKIWNDETQQFDLLPGNASVEDDLQTVISDDGSYKIEYNSDKTFTVKAAEFYLIEEVRVSQQLAPWEDPQTVLPADQIIPGNDLTELQVPLTDITRDIDIQVTVIPYPYVITVESDTNGSAVTDIVAAKDGDTATITITANSGYIIDKISVNGKITTLGDELVTHDLILDNIDEDKDVYVTFKKEPVLEKGIAIANSETWTTVYTNRTYPEMVVVTTPVTSIGLAPFCVRVENVTEISFDIKLQRLDNLGDTISDIEVTYFVANEGNYTVENDGIKFEAVRFNSTITAGKKASWNREVSSYINSYISPVVIGQVMSSNDANWSVFWSSGSKRQNPASATQLYVGKHIGEDPNITRADETLGYMVFESGSAIYNGATLQTALGADSVRGTQNGSYNYTVLSDAESVITTISAMDGGDGGFAVLLDSPVASGDQITLAIDEDQINDGERSHTTEQVSWLAIKSLTETTALADNFTLSGPTLNGNLLSNDFIIDEVQIELLTAPANGSILIYADGQFDYTSAAQEADTFEYKLVDGEGITLSTGAVTITP
ncbi:MAG: Ig-like domain-containing protein [Lentisphaerales bacterium]|nr:Ig-like domain-containing protein [Lentisphaerales bacterium]